MNERSECVRLIQVESGPEVEEIRSLFLEYAQSLDFNLCFQNFDLELRELPRVYRPPHGRFYVAGHIQPDYRPDGPKTLDVGEASHTSSIQAKSNNS